MLDDISEPPKKAEGGERDYQRQSMKAPTPTPFPVHAIAQIQMILREGCNKKDQPGPLLMRNEGFVGGNDMPQSERALMYVSRAREAQLNPGSYAYGHRVV